MMWHLWHFVVCYAVMRHGMNDVTLVACVAYYEVICHGMHDMRSWHAAVCHVVMRHNMRQVTFVASMASRSLAEAGVLAHILILDTYTQHDWLHKAIELNAITRMMKWITLISIGGDLQKLNIYHCSRILDMIELGGLLDGF